jgi:hypothetical protein
MSKQQRELLILFGILVVLGGIFYMRFGRGGQSPNPQLAQLQQGQPPAGGGTPGAGTPGQPGTQLPTLATQFPLDFLLPGLSDSALVAKIMRERTPNPFAQNHLRPPRVRSETTQPTRPTRPAQPDTVLVELDSWPRGMGYRGVTPVLSEPGVFTVNINGQALRTGDEIPGTGFMVVEVNPLLVRIRKEETVGNVTTITTYRHIIGRLSEVPW